MLMQAIPLVRLSAVLMDLMHRVTTEDIEPQPKLPGDAAKDW